MKKIKNEVAGKAKEFMCPYVERTWEEPTVWMLVRATVDKRIWSIVSLIGVRMNTLPNGYHDEYG